MPGSFDINAKEHFGEGLRIPPIRIWDKGKYLGDIVRMFASNTRAPDMIIGDLQAQAEATRRGRARDPAAGREVRQPTIMTAFREVQDYVEILTRRRIAEMPDGVWETEDYIDYDPSLGEGLIPIKVKMTIEGDQLSLRPLGLASGGRDVPQRRLRQRVLGRRSPAPRRSSPTCRSTPASTARCRSTSGPVGSVVNAPWPIAVTGLLLRARTRRS